MIWSLDSLETTSAGSSKSLPILGPPFDCCFHKDTCLLVAPDETNSLRVLQDGHILKFQSPSDMSLITCVAMTSNANTVAYGCYNGSVRLYYPESSAVKTLGNHRQEVKSVIVKHAKMPNEDMEVAVVVSGGRDGTLAIWWDGGRAFNCARKHEDSIQEVRYFSRPLCFSRILFFEGDVYWQ